MPISSLYILIGALALLGGGCFLALVPSTLKSLQDQLQAGKITAPEIAKRKKILVMIGACLLVVGAALLVANGLQLL